MSEVENNQSNDELLWQSRAIGEVITAIANGDFMRKVPLEAPEGMAWNSEQLEVAKTLNGFVDQLNQFAHEATRISRETGVEGRFGGQMEVENQAGTWKDLTVNINLMVFSLTDQVRDLASVATSIARGDLSRKVTVGAQGEMGELKDTSNVMVDQFNAVAVEMQRVARELGTDSILGGQCEVKGISGVWKELIDNFNIMAQNLTLQIRATHKIVTAIAKGNFNLKLIIESPGEVGTLAKTLNDMSDRLSIFASEITTVVRKVGMESQLGFQAEVPNADGTWQDLINNINGMANTLTVQVRSLNDAAQAAIDGDTTRRVTVEAQGEMVELRDALNVLIERSATAA